jgi:hypothetical protein
MFILATGNILGAFWNYLFFQFSDAGIKYIGPIFTAFYALIFPFVNLTWVVPFWSFCLSLLTTSKPSLEVKR